MSSKLSRQPSDNIVSSLCSIYDRYGYSRYKMNKFEEYDLYAHNKDFLISDGVITFTDTNGKLMALKPDVTLSIVKNTKDSADNVNKLYYNENVYRISKGSRTFKEIMQTGLECIGEVDDYCIYEVLKLAADSLQSIDENSILDISHIGILSDVIDKIGAPREYKDKIFHLVGEKNLHELTRTCSELNIDDEKVSVLKELSSLHGTPDNVLPKMKNLLSGIADDGVLSQFENIVSALNKGSLKKCVRIDFSVVDDIRYYNGIVFKGFVEGIPVSVLSGGQYDTLMRKMNRKSQAIGFAVYLDALEQYGKTRDEYDVDAVLLYGNDEKLENVANLAEILSSQGSSVSVQKQIPNGLKYKKLFKIENGEVKTIENNA